MLYRYQRCCREGNDATPFIQHLINCNIPFAMNSTSSRIVTVLIDSKYVTSALQESIQSFSFQDEDALDAERRGLFN